MDDLISRKKVIDEIARWIGYIDEDMILRIQTGLKTLPSAQPDNQIHLCDSCKYSYPDCPSKSDDVIFGNGKGNDNICACNKYKPSARQEQKTGKWEMTVDRSGFVDWFCSSCGGSGRGDYCFCPWCNAKMEGING